MTNHPQLKELIDSINNRSKQTLTFTYGDGHSATLSVNATTITVSTDNPELNSVLAKLIEKILRGDIDKKTKRAIDKKGK